MRRAAIDVEARVQTTLRLAEPRKVIGLGYRTVLREAQATTGLILRLLRQNYLRMRNRSGVFGS